MSPEDEQLFTLKTGSLLFTSGADREVTVTVGDKGVSGVNEVYTLCLTVETSPPSEGTEVRAMLLKGGECVDVTVINNNSEFQHTPSPITPLTHTHSHTHQCHTSHRGYPDAIAGAANIHQHVSTAAFPSRIPNMCH